MSEPSETELREMAQRLLGRDLEGEGGRMLRARLRNMARVKALLADWEARLGETAPITVTPVPAPGDHGPGDHGPGDHGPGDDGPGDDGDGGH